MRRSDARLAEFQPGAGDGFGGGDRWEPAPNRDARRPDHEGPLERAWLILRRHPLLVLQAILVTGLLAYGYSTTRDKQYTATASILFRSAAEDILGSGGTFVDPNRQAATNEELLSLPVVAERTSRELGGAVNAAAVASAVSIVSTPQADVVDIQATTTDPTLSAQVASAYGVAFKKFRLERARAEIDGALSLARAAEATLSATERAGDRGTALRDRINQLETARSLQTGGAELVQAASRPTEPSAPKPMRNGILGVMLGGIFGFALAALRERQSKTTRTVEEIERAYGRPVLARVPRSRLIARRRSLPSRSEEAEAFRVLRTALRFYNVDRELRSVLVTSALPGEGKSTTARQLAETMTLMGDRVVLIEADMHPRSAATARDADAGHGLSGVLVGGTLGDALQQVPIDTDNDEVRTLSVLPSGPTPPNPSELLETERMREILEDLEEHFDLVIIDSPPVGVMSDALPLVPQVSGVLVVAAVERTTIDGIREVSRQIDLLGATVFGIVANFAPAHERAAGSYYGKR